MLISWFDHAWRNKTEEREIRSIYLLDTFHGRERERNEGEEM